VKHYGLNPPETIIEIAPKPGEKILHTEQILEVLETEGSAIALVLMGGMNYYTGQFFDLEKIANAAHKIGAICGFDLAHVVGNIPLQLHDWNVDFAVWCSYKYLNAGPGAVGGIYIHEQWASDINMPRLGGWWGMKNRLDLKWKRDLFPNQMQVDGISAQLPFLI
jgi:kynureninase